MSDKLIQKTLEDVEAQFNRITDEVNKIQEQVNEGNRQIAARKEELVRLQGSYKTLKELETASEKPTKAEEAKKK